MSLEKAHRGFPDYPAVGRWSVEAAGKELPNARAKVFPAVEVTCVSASAAFRHIDHMREAQAD